MRPLRLVLEGFSAYRQRVEVDLSGVDYFSLSGPTGSGKSSLIDAMVFALYGRVPRLGGASAAPAISTGRDQATVSFDFIVDEQVYTVIRDLHRTKAGGASVREARLERGSSSLESGSGNVTRAVEGLLNLSYEDFTRTVILPQGEFARFLSATPSERQQLLRGLMGLDIYSEVASRARTRESVARAIAREGQSRLESLELPDEDNLARQRERLAALGDLVTSTREAEEHLDRQQAGVVAIGERVDYLADARQRLIAMRAPEHLEELGRLLDETAESIDQVRVRKSELSDESQSIDSDLRGLPNLEAIEGMEKTRRRFEELEFELSQILLDGMEEELKEAEGSVIESQANLDQVRADLETKRVAHAAHDIANSLAVGDMCPVCSRRIESPLEADEISDLDELKREAAEAEKRLAEGRKRVSTLSERLGADRARAAALSKMVVDLEADLSDFDNDALVAVKREVTERLGRREAIRVETSALDERAGEARERWDELAERQRSLGIDLMARRESVADLKPTPSRSDDAIVQWKELLEWREGELERTDAEMAVRTAELTEAVDAIETQTRQLAARLKEFDVEVEAGFSVAVARAHEQAAHRVELVEKAMEASKALEAQIAEANQQAMVAHAVGQHLRSDKFERWLMVGAIGNLVDGANSLLAQLSAGAYSLIADELGSFDVVDHRNANESRPIATLSGGETFLVSLALALSLAETLSAAGGAGLDAIILDEGFGTLDEELLEVVATVLEDLSGRGLMVGIITHVKELASLAQVRLRVRKEPDGSVVERLS